MTKTVLVVGATGATGRQLVYQLLEMGQTVKVIVRSPEKLPASWKNHERLTIIHAAVLDLSEAEMTAHVKGCHAVASCLGHNLNLKGIYGRPRKLVRDAVRLLCSAIKRNAPEQAIRFVLMNTSGNRNRDLHEPVSFGHKLMLGFIRIILPPHADNEQAADHLRVHIGQDDPMIEWVAVRPDSLIDESEVSAYSAHPSPLRDALFNPGKTSRINVAHFMATLITDDESWNLWKGKMPVIYNDSSE